MIRRQITAGAAMAVVLGVASLIGWMLLPLRASEFVRLRPGILMESRGGNPDQVLYQESCDFENTLFPCQNVNDNCSSCAKETFTQVEAGTDGGYTIKGANTYCGLIYNGTCNANLQCVTGGNSTGGCDNPSVVVQPPQ